MEERDLYLVQYTRKGDFLNRFYMSKDNSPSKEISRMKSVVRSNQAMSLDDVAEAVEVEVLEDSGFLRIQGMDESRKKYKEILPKNFFKLQAL